MYSEIVMDHFTNPRNVGKMDNADAIGVAGSPECGDTTTLYLKIDNGVITNATFQTLGCAAAIASSSMFTEMLVGKTLGEALKLTNLEVVQALGGLPEPKIHCSVMAEDSVKAAIDDYFTRQIKV